jgi:hypothetical protein
VVAIIFRIEAFIMWQVMRFRTQDATCNYKQTKQSLQIFANRKPTAQVGTVFHIPEFTVKHVQLIIFPYNILKTNRFY